MPFSTTSSLGRSLIISSCKRLKDHDHTNGQDKKTGRTNFNIACNVTLLNSYITASLFFPENHPMITTNLNSSNMKFWLQLIEFQNMFSYERMVLKFTMSIKKSCTV